MASMTCQDYSEKSVVVRGEDTRKYKETLKQLGGKWNPSLQGGGGWIFSKKQEEQVKHLIKTGEISETEEKKKEPRVTSKEPRVTSKEPREKMIIDSVYDYYTKLPTEISKFHFLQKMNQKLTAPATVNSDEDLSDEEVTVPPKRLLGVSKSVPKEETIEQKLFKLVCKVNKKSTTFFPIEDDPDQVDYLKGKISEAVQKKNMGLFLTAVRNADVCSPGDKELQTTAEKYFKGL